MKYHPVPELTAQSYMNLRTDVEKVIANWIAKEDIETARVFAMKFYGPRVRLEHKDGFHWFRPISSIPYGTLVNLQKALRLKSDF